MSLKKLSTCVFVCITAALVLAGCHKSTQPSNVKLTTDKISLQNFTPLTEYTNLFTVPNYDLSAHIPGGVLFAQMLNQLVDLGSSSTNATNPSADYNQFAYKALQADFAKLKKTALTNTVLQGSLPVGVTVDWKNVTVNDYLLAFSNQCEVQNNFLIKPKKVLDSIKEKLDEQKITLTSVQFDDLQKRVFASIGDYNENYKFACSYANNLVQNYVVPAMQAASGK